MTFKVDMSDVIDVEQIAGARSRVKIYSPDGGSWVWPRNVQVWLRAWLTCSVTTSHCGSQKQEQR